MMDTLKSQTKLTASFFFLFEYKISIELFKKQVTKLYLRLFIVRTLCKKITNFNIYIFKNGICNIINCKKHL